MLGQLRLDPRPIAEQDKLGVGMSRQRSGGAGNNDRCADITTHGVKRDSNLLRHERPGNPIPCGRDVAISKFVALRPGGDNSVSLSRHNLLTPVFWFRTSGQAESNL